MKKNMLLKLMKQFYGICDSGDYFNAAKIARLIKELALERAVL